MKKIKRIQSIKNFFGAMGFFSFVVLLLAASASETMNLVWVGLWVILGLALMGISYWGICSCDQQIQRERYRRFRNTPNQNRPQTVA
ncbi:MAG: hypothetical protein ACOX60_01310 [Massiliimalia sp.]|jgi:hypothetical protein